MKAQLEEFTTSFKRFLAAKTTDFDPPKAAAVQKPLGSTHLDVTEVHQLKTCTPSLAHGAPSPRSSPLPPHPYLTPKASASIVLASIRAQPLLGRNHLKGSAGKAELPQIEEPQLLIHEMRFT